VAIPQTISVEYIRKLEEARQEGYERMLESYNENLVVSHPEKERWLEMYAKCLSPTIACRQSGTSMGSYKRWRGTDPDFCRAMNVAIAHGRENLLGSVMSRATGYVQEDEDGNIITDALGNPIYSGGSDTLAKALLASEMDLPKSSAAAVTVTVNLGALLGASEPNTIEPNIIEHEAMVKDAIELDLDSSVDGDD